MVITKDQLVPMSSPITVQLVTLRTEITGATGAIPTHTQGVQAIRAITLPISLTELLAGNTFY